MGKKFVIEAVVTFRQEFELDWEWQDEPPPEGVTPAELLKKLQGWAPTAEEYTHESEMMFTEEIAELKMQIIDPSTGKSVPYPNKEKQDG